jgi:hypothetical protein
MPSPGMFSRHQLKLKLAAGVSNQMPQSWIHVCIIIISITRVSRQVPCARSKYSSNLPWRKTSNVCIKALM